jgi:hypothetical protein
MARAIGKTKSWLWWLLGGLCTLLFGSTAGAMEGGYPYPPYGVPNPSPPPAEEKPAVSEAEKQAAGTLVDAFLAPVEAIVPTPEVTAEIDRLLGELRAEDPEQARRAADALAAIGPAALGRLRELAADQALERSRELVSERPVRVFFSAAAIVARIEEAARDALVEKLRATGLAGPLVLQQRIRSEEKAAGAAEKAAARAEREGDAEAAEKSRAEAAASRERSAALTKLLDRVRPAPVPVATPAPPMGIPPYSGAMRPTPRPRPADGLSARYGPARPKPQPAPDESEVF